MEKEEVFDNYEDLVRFRNWLNTDQHDEFFYVSMIVALGNKIETIGQNRRENALKKAVQEEG